MKRKSIRFLSMCLAMVLLLAAVPAVTAFAESITVYVHANTVKVYKKWSTSSKLLGTMNFGQSMTCTAVKGDWAQVVNDYGHVGYCYRYALATSNPNRYNNYVYAAKDRVPVYTRPTTSSRIMGYMPLNTRTTCVAITNDGSWLRLKNGRAYGYALKSGMDTKPFNPNEGTTVWCIEHAAAVDSGPGNWDSVGTMYFGQSFTKLGTEGSYVKLRNSAGTIGYCHESAVSTQNPNIYDQTMYTRVSGNILFAKSKVGTASANINANTKVTLVAIDKEGFWGRVKLNNNYYYIPLLFLKSAKNQEVEFFAKEPTPIYEKANSSSKILYKLGTCETIHLIGGNGGYAYVSTADSSIKGYVMSQFLMQDALWP